MENNIFEIAYKEGRGHLKLDLSAILPCAAGDMKRICSFLDLSADPVKNAETIYNYISGRVADLKEARAMIEEKAPGGKEAIADKNAEIKRYLANVSVLAKNYGLPEIKDDDAQIIMHAATVYGIGGDGKGGKVAHEYKGWFFEKAGYRFEVYKEGSRRDARYNILLGGTGLQIATAYKKNAAPVEITESILDMLNKSENKKRIDAAQAEYKRVMEMCGYSIESAGSMEPAKVQAPETIQEPAKVQEPETVQEPAKVQAAKEDAKRAKSVLKLVKTIKRGRKMYDVMYSSDSISIRGKGDIKTFPCEYNFSESGAVLLFIIVGTKEDGRKEKQRVKIEKNDVYFGAARAAAKAAGAVDPTEKKKPAKVQEPETIQEPAKIQGPETVQEPAKVQEPETVQEPAKDPKAARGPVPEKTFIGETIQGNGWRIYFDGETARTRVIFDNTPDKVARAAVENAGFYYSPKMDSWNKKLTFKAYRAAKKLAADLEKISA